MYNSYSNTYKNNKISSNKTIIIIITTTTTTITIIVTTIATQIRIKNNNINYNCK